MAVRHGIYITETDTPAQAALMGDSAIVCIGTAPIYKKDNHANLINKPILCRSAQEAMDIFGYSNDFQAFTLCQMMWVTANLYPVAPVVYIAVGQSNWTSDSSTYEAGTTSETIVVPAGSYAILDSIVAKQPAEGSTYLTLVKDRDYTVEGNEDGGFTISFITGTGSSYSSSLSVTVEYEKQTPSLTTDTEIIGSYNSSTGIATGAELIPFVYPKLGVVPSIICAPKYSKSAAVGAALMAKAANINGVFKGLAVLDLESTTSVTVTSVQTAKATAGFTSPFCYPVWPACKVKGEDAVMNLSTVAAALMAYTDAQNGGVPRRSPSNRLIGRNGSGVVATCTESGAEILLTQDQATTINNYGVNTAINLSGWRMFGSYTGAFPESTDPKDIWCSVRRMFNWQANNFIQLYFEKVDDPLNIVLVESIVDSENIRCGAFVPDSWAGAEMEYRVEDNPTSQLLQGKVVFRQRIAPYAPAQEIDNILSYDVSMITESMAALQ